MTVPSGIGERHRVLASRIAINERSTIDRTYTPAMQIRTNHGTLTWVGIAAGVMSIVTVIFLSGFFVGRDARGDIDDAPATAQPLHCQALCIGETNVSQQAWYDCINHCMSTGGVG